MKTIKEKNFDAVAFQRKRREELSKLFNTNPSEFWRQLEEVREKYRKMFRSKEKQTA